MTLFLGLAAIYFGTLALLIGANYWIYTMNVKLLYTLIDKLDEISKTIGDE